MPTYVWVIENGMKRRMSEPKAKAYVKGNSNAHIETKAEAREAQATTEAKASGGNA